MTRTIIMTEEDGQELIQSFWQIGLLRHRPPLTQEVVPLTLSCATSCRCYFFLYLPFRKYRRLTQIVLLGILMDMFIALHYHLKTPPSSSSHVTVLSRDRERGGLIMDNSSDVFFFFSISLQTL